MNFPDPNLPPVVIVDDCEDDAFLLRHRLRLGGIANPVVTLASCDGALAYLTSLYGPNSAAHLIFIDIKMSGGFELIAALREDPRLDDSKIVAATYSNDPTDLKHALEAGVDGYIMKFPDPDILAEFVLHGPWFDATRRTAPALHQVLCA